jgi:RNA polymerase sigma-70 factor, ECF subfamily
MSRSRPLRLERAQAAPVEARTDDELLALAQAGVRAAFSELVERHAARVVHACSRFVNDPDVGAELAQETWVAVWQRREEYRCDGGFLLWLITIARNQCRNHLRAHGVAQKHARLATNLDEMLSPDQIDILLVEERRRHVRDAVAKLPEAMREALLLRFAEDLRYDEMVHVLGVRTSESTLRSRVHHGLRLLRNLLEKKK